MSEDTKTDTRYWYWRHDDGEETTPEGPFATREAALADVPQHYAPGSIPERVLVGRCTPPLERVGLSSEDIVETLSDQMMDIAECGLSVVDKPEADAVLWEWVERYISPEWSWMTDEREEWVVLAQVGGAS